MGRVAAAKQEWMLLEAHKVQLPQPIKSIHSSWPEDDIGRYIIQQYQPVLLNDHNVFTVLGDGNCFYRAISLGMFGDDQYHLHLRLLVSLEIIDFKVCYDIDHPRYDDHVNDNRIVCSSYETLYFEIHYFVYHTA